MTCLGTGEHREGGTGLSGSLLCPHSQHDDISDGIAGRVFPSESIQAGVSFTLIIHQKLGAGSQLLFCVFLDSVFV